jgi:NTP pyrophosphatase (non-canonical NTP hydrolase)
MTDEEKVRTLMSITQEECAEVIQAISKVFRFGVDMRYPENGPTNRERLEEEIGDLLCMISLMVAKGYVNESNILDAEERKLDKLRKWSNGLL